MEPQFSRSVAHRRPKSAAFSGLQLGGSCATKTLTLKIRYRLRDCHGMPWCNAPETHNIGPGAAWSSLSSCRMGSRSPFDAPKHATKDDVVQRQKGIPVRQAE